MNVLIEVDVLDTATGNRVTIRASSANDRALTAIGGLKWPPAITKKPKLALSLFDGAFLSAIQTGNASLELAMNVIELSYPNAKQYLFAGSPFRIYAETGTPAWPWAPRMAGRIKSFEVSGNNRQIIGEVDDTQLIKDVLNSSYAGTGGIEGGDNIKGTQKPWIFGYAKNVEPVLINEIDYIYQFSGYGPIQAIDVLYERGSGFGTSSGDYATYAALLAASVPEGSWATCLAQGLVRLGAPQYGVITGDVKGHKVGAATPRRTGAILSTIASALSIPLASINATSLSALDTAVPYNINLVLTNQITFIDLARELALSCNAQAGISLDGKLFVARVAISAASFTLDAQGRRMPPVISSKEVDVSPPFKRIMMGADRSWRVHSYDEVSFQAQIIDRGRYDANETYREGNIADLADGQRWIYVNTEATKGNFPFIGSAYWEQLSTASVVDFANVVGTTRPADNADVTGENTSANTNNVGTKSAAQVVATVTQLPVVEQTVADIQGDITDLFTTYGTTTSAAAAAAEALGYRDAAEGFKNTSEAAKVIVVDTAAIVAGDKLETNNAKGEAISAKDTAVLAKDDAAASVIAAASQVTLAAKSAFGASAAVASIVPDAFTADAYTTSPTGIAVLGLQDIIPDNTLSADRTRAQAEVGVSSNPVGLWLRKAVPISVGQKLRIDYKIKLVAGGGLSYHTDYSYALDATGAVLGAWGPASIYSTPASLTSYSLTIDASAVISAYPTAAYMQLGILYNRELNIVDSKAPGTRTDVYQLSLKDITESQSAALSATASNNSAGIAATKANDAGVFADAAQASKLSAEVGAAETFPSGFAQNGKYWGYIYGSDETTIRPEQGYAAGKITYPVTVDGKVLRVNNIVGSYVHIAPRHRLPIAGNEGRRFRITTKARYITEPTSGTPKVVFSAYGLTADYATLMYTGYISGLFDISGNNGSVLPIGSIFTQVSEIVVSDPPVASGGNIAAFITPGIYVWSDDPSHDTGVVDIIGITVEDVTSETVAKGSAAAAVTSASNAAASESAADGFASTASSQSGIAVTAKNDAVAAAGVSTTQAGLADDHRAAALAASTLSSSFSAEASGAAHTRGLTYNGDFEGEDKGWTYSIGVYKDDYPGIGKVYRASQGQASSLYGTRLTPIDPSKTYQVNWKFVVHSVDQSFYAGVKCYNASKVELGNVYFPNLVNATKPHSNFYEDSARISGTEAGASPLVGNHFMAGTAYAVPIMLGNYGGAAAPAFHDYVHLYIENVDQLKAAETAATVSAQQATLADGFKAAAETASNLSATYAGNSKRSAGTGPVLISDFQQGLDHWTFNANHTAWDGYAPYTHPTPVRTDWYYSFPLETEGKALYVAGNLQDIDLAPQGAIKIEAGRKYRMTARIACSIAAPTIFAVFLNAAYQYQANVNITPALNGAFTTHVLDFDSPSYAYMRPMMRIPAGSTCYVLFFKIEDITESKSAAASALISENKATIASDRAAEALLSSNISADFATQSKGGAMTSGLNRNSHFAAGLSNWYEGYTVPSNTPVNNAVHATDHVGAANVLKKTYSSNAPVYLRSEIIPIQAGRRYKISARWYKAAYNNIAYVGLACVGSNGGNVGPNAGLIYNVAPGESAAGWSQNSAEFQLSDLYAGTTSIILIAFLNYPNPSLEGNVDWAMDYLYIEDITESKSAASSATISNDAKVIATAAAAAATQQATISAKLSGNYINPNPTYQDWTDPAAHPASYTPWAGGLMTRVVGADGKIALRGSCGVGGEVGLVQSAELPDMKTTPGWYVVEADVTLESGSLTGAGGLFYFRNAAGTVVQQVGFTLQTDMGLGAGTVGQRYRGTFLFHASNTDITKTDLYHMTGWTGLGAVAAKQLLWHKLGFRAATEAEISSKTVLPTLSASVTTMQGAITTLEDSAAYYETVVAASGSTPAKVSLKAGKNGSAVDLVAESITIQNPVGGALVTVASFQGGVATLDNALIRRLKVFPRSDSAIAMRVLLEPLKFLAKDGDVVQYQGGDSFGALPTRIEPNSTGLPALAAGSAYQISATDITPTQFTARIKSVSTPSNTNQATGAGAATGSTPAYAVEKPSAADAVDGNYEFTFAGTLARTSFSYEPVGGGSIYYSASYSGSFDIYATNSAASNAWVKVGTVNVYRNESGTVANVPSIPAFIAFTENTTVSIAQAIGQHGGKELGVHPGVGGTLSGLSNVKYVTQTVGSTTSIGTLIPWLVYPPAAN